MITSSGKSIIGKYLIGQAPAYASYIAIGCGPQPKELTYDFSSEDRAEFSAKQSLDFEMFRVPITSRGYVTENNQTKVVFTAELPTEERYEITEIGLWSAGSNPSAKSNDSKTVFAFDDTKNWVISPGLGEIPIVPGPLDAGNDGVDDQGNNHITVTHPIFKTNSDNRIFTDVDRVARYERCRFLNRIIMMRGNSSELVLDGEHLDVQSGSPILLGSESLNFTQNAPTDELKLAFSVINKDPDPTIFPDKVRILVEFSSSSVFGEGEWARFEVILDSYDFENNRYIVITKQLQDMYKSSAGFSWSSVNTVKIYSSIIDGITTSSQFYVGLDALRLENKDTSNPLYGLTGYTVVKNNDSKTIVKSANKTSFIEFRFGMDVG
jgi:hypothetical protein